MGEDTERAGGCTTGEKVSSADPLLGGWCSQTRAARSNRCLTHVLSNAGFCLAALVRNLLAERWNCTS